MVKELLAHIPFHMGAHHVSLIAYIIFAQALDEIHRQKRQGDERKRAEDHGAVFCEKSVCRRTQDLRVGKVCQADKCRTEKIDEENCLVRAIVVNEFFNGLHHKPPSFIL